MPLRQLIYASRALGNFDEPTLAAMLTHFRSANAEHNVTGVLLFIAGFFAQVLEGDSSTVNALFNKIQCDPRHFDVRCLVNCAITERSCPNWTMAFCDLRAVGYSDFRQIEHQLKQIKTGDTIAARRFMLDLIDTLPIT